MNTELRIYVADLAAYNSGNLRGVWVDATGELESIYEAIQVLLDASPEPHAEEYAIHDYEGFGVCGLGEYDSIESVREIACFIGEHSDNEGLAGEVLNYLGGNLEDAQRAIEEQYNGCYSSLADFAQELTEGTGDISEQLAAYIDYERMGRDMELSGDVFTIETGHEEVHIFWAH